MNGTPGLRDNFTPCDDPAPRAARPAMRHGWRGRLASLQPIKGALVSLQWALRMHGFNPAEGGELAPGRIIERRP